MLRKNTLWALPAAAALIAVGIYAMAPAVNAARSDCCTWSEEPLTAAERSAAFETASMTVSSSARLGESLAVTMHVADILVGWTQEGGVKKRPNVSVRILDEANGPVYGATVTGDWSGCFKQNGVVTGPTGDLDLNKDGTITDDETGWVLMTASKTGVCFQTQCLFTFTVTNVSNVAYTYDAMQNVETADFTKCNPYKP